MAKLPVLAIFVLMAPAVTLGIASALATDTPAELAGDGQQRAAHDARHMSQQAQTDHTMTTADAARELRMASDRAQQQVKAHGIYLSSAPADSFGADELLGSKLKTQSNDETIGTINDLIMDAHGQIIAVVVAAGEFLGLGERQVAVSWDAIDRRSKPQNDGYDLRVDTTTYALEDAPEFNTETKQH